MLFGSKTYDEYLSNYDLEN
jgi:hypothetical protein